ncbi:hypothetical protein C1646_760771 [Rhizophagus diaphanus]|nr:hypothetical protein C1646_760771 [Rhizophagus diaphanus] [Rhizophagus sp. MUCL 43196]
MSLKPLSLEKITKWQYQYNKIKVNDMPFHSKHFNTPGCVAIDVQPCFMKFYSKAEKSSLAFYLNECGLESKMDMSFHRMFKYYGRALRETNATTAEQMYEVAKYCMIDALSCQWLMVKHNVINEYREVANIAFISLSDAHYFARGMKVCNLLSASVWQRGILTSMISNQQTETGKYPGAYDCLTWSIQHNNILEEKGLYAIVLEYLSSKRNEMKKRLAPLKEKKEDMELVIASMGKGLSLPEAIEKELANAEGKKRDSLTKNLYHFINKAKHEFMAEYDSICFDCSCLDAKQYALKVYMNTFYGTAGNSKSPFFLRALAGGVTSAGQRNIKLVADFIKSKGFQIKYGDTDSLYLVPPERCFQEYDEAYDSGNGILKEEYWSRMVNISMEVMEKLRDKVNDFLRKDNGSSYPKMAYEEVLFPVVFTGKKKYYGIPHESKSNFNKELFIQGVEIVKQGKSNLFCKIGKRIIDESMRVDNTRTLHQIVKDVLKETVKDISQTDLNEIIKTAVHTRKEADAKRLIKRGLTSEPYLYEIPESGERFEYVVIENDSSDKVGDKMEYPEPSSEIVLGGLKKFKDGNKAGDSKADDGGVDGDDLNEDEEDEDEIDEDEVSKIRDALAQKSAEKWIRSILDKQEESIRIKLTTLLAEISEVDIEYRESMYKLVTKERAMSLEQYLTSYYLDEYDSSESDIDEIIELYG